MSTATVTASIYPASRARLRSTRSTTTSSMVPGARCCADSLAATIAGTLRRRAASRATPGGSLTGECPNSGLSGSGLVRWESGHPGGRPVLDGVRPDPDTQVVTLRIPDVDRCRTLSKTNPGRGSPVLGLVTESLVHNGAP